MMSNKNGQTKYDELTLIVFRNEIAHYAIIQWFN